MSDGFVNDQWKTLSRAPCSDTLPPSNLCRTVRGAIFLLVFVVAVTSGPLGPSKFKTQPSLGTTPGKATLDAEALAEPEGSPLEADVFAAVAPGGVPLVAPAEDPLMPPC